MANLQDVVALFGGGTTLDVNAASAKDERWSYSSVTNDVDNINISVGPNPPSGDKFSYFKLRNGTLWNNEANLPGTWSIKLYNVNRKIWQLMTKNITNEVDLFGIRKLRWNLIGFSCVNHVSRSLWAVGIPTLPINLHPFILNTQLLVRQIGIYSSPYLYNM